MYGCENWTNKKSWTLKNWCFWVTVLEKTLESPLDHKEIQPVHSKGNQFWIFIGRTDAEANTLATWCEELTHLKRPWCWERLRAGGEGDDRGLDGWMASLTQWTWVWVDSRSWWWTGRPGVLRYMGSQRVRHDWVTELNWTQLNRLFKTLTSVSSSDKWGWQAIFYRVVSKASLALTHGRYSVCCSFGWSIFK